MRVLWDLENRMDISVIICTWNNSGRLAMTLGAVSGCIVPPGVKWQVVLVNNSCTDDTDQVAQRFAGKLPLVYVKEPQQGLSRARNAGLKAASGELILFTDDDVRPFREWIETYWSAYQERPAGYYFGGPIQIEYETLKPDEELLRFAPPSVRGLYYGPTDRILMKREGFISANWACPAEVIRNVGFFDIQKGLNAASKKIRTGEERDLMDRLNNCGWKGLYLRKAELVHFVPEAKCTLRHIGDRAEGFAAFVASNRNNTSRSKMICGIPRWMIKQLIMLWIKWTWLRVKGETAYGEYIEFRKMKGTIEGHRG